MHKREKMFARTKVLLTLTTAISLAACAPTYAPRMDAPVMPTLEPQQPSVEECKPVERPAIKIAPLDPRPLLPEATQSPCPSDSGLYACFMVDQTRSGRSASRFCTTIVSTAATHTTGR